MSGKIANHYEDLVALHEWMVDMNEHIHEFDMCGWDIHFPYNASTYHSQMRHSEKRNKDVLTFARLDENAEEHEVLPVEFFDSLQRCIESYEFAVAFDYDKTDKEADFYVTALREDDTIFINVSEDLRGNLHEEQRARMAFRCFKTKADALAWALTLERPELFAQEHRPMRHTFHMWK